eukprot:jgi/Picsp_1/6140/NSC_03494-R1_transmembrane atpase
MEVPAGQDGIQQLLRAEQEAQAIVAKARQAKAERLKQAKEEAVREVALYKKEKEEEFKQSVEDDSMSSKQNVEKLSGDADREIAAVQKNTDSRRNQVLDLLLAEVKTVA